MQNRAANGSPTKDRLVSFSEVEFVTGLTRSTIYRHIRAGSFPKPLKIAGRTLWSALDLDQWMDLVRHQGRFA